MKKYMIFTISSIIFLTIYFLQIIRDVKILLIAATALVMISLYPIINKKAGKLIKGIAIFYSLFVNAASIFIIILIPFNMNVKSIVPDDFGYIEANKGEQKTKDDILNGVREFEAITKDLFDDKYFNIRASEITNLQKEILLLKSSKLREDFYGVLLNNRYGIKFDENKNPYKMPILNYSAMRTIFELKHMEIKKLLKEDKLLAKKEIIKLWKIYENMIKSQNELISFYITLVLIDGTIEFSEKNKIEFNDKELKELYKILTDIYLSLDKSMENGFLLEYESANLFLRQLNGQIKDYSFAKEFPDEPYKKLIWPLLNYTDSHNKIFGTYSKLIKDSNIDYYIYLKNYQKPKEIKRFSLKNPIGQIIHAISTPNMHKGIEIKEISKSRIKLYKFIIYKRKHDYYPIPIDNLTGEKYIKEINANKTGYRSEFVTGNKKEIKFEL